MEDASLDEFLDAAGDGSDPEDSEAQARAEDEEHEPDATESNLEEATATESDAEEPDAEEPDPGTPPTSDWHPEGAPCASCGAVVERRWRADAGLVCPDCKRW